MPGGCTVAQAAGVWWRGRWHAVPRRSPDRARVSARAGRRDSTGRRPSTPEHPPRRRRSPDTPHRCGMDRHRRDLARLELVYRNAPLPREGAAQHAAHGGEQRRPLRLVEVGGVRQGEEACRVEDLVGVRVSDAGELFLLLQQRFQLLAPAGEHAVELVGRVVGGCRVSAELRDRWNLGGFVDDPQPDGQPGSAVGEEEFRAVREAQHGDGRRGGCRRGELRGIRRRGRRRVGRRGRRSGRRRGIRRIGRRGRRRGIRRRFTAPSHPSRATETHDE